MKTLVLAPHADDEIIGCGGYVVKLISKGNQVDVAYLTAPGEVRKNEINQVAKFMGFTNVYFLDQGIERDLHNIKELPRLLLNAIRTSSPNIMLFPHEHEQDKDHKFLYDIARECSVLCESEFALKPSQTPVSIDILLGYEVWTPITNPSLNIDISKFLKTKKEAMSHYKSQLKYKDFIGMFEGLNRYRGIVSGVGDFAESFSVYKINEGKIK